ncbi:MAG: alpha/beta hydrolase [Candidatus Liptonbacteria bacterium]|nr:alpha/beta hydrolase [Candidatus Liptonbacteria bacterium]
MNKLSQKQIAVNGLLLNYYAGGGDKFPALLFLHGWRSEGSVWFPAVENFNTENQIYCLDLPGFGKSELPREPYGVENYSEIVSAFISKLGLEKVVIIGHSFGGRIAIKLASKNPDFLQGIVLVDSAGFVDKTLLNKLKRIIAKPLRPIFKFKPFHGLRKSIYRLIGSEDYVATPLLRETYLKVIGEDLSGDMERIDTPAMIIWGAQDKDTPVKWARKMKDIIKNSKLVVLNGAGHFSFLDKKEEFSDILKNFLAQL